MMPGDSQFPNPNPPRPPKPYQEPRAGIMPIKPAPPKYRSAPPVLKKGYEEQIKSAPPVMKKQPPSNKPVAPKNLPLTKKQTDPNYKYDYSNRGNKAPLSSSTSTPKREMAPAPLIKNMPKRSKGVGY